MILWSRCEPSLSSLLKDRIDYETRLQISLRGRQNTKPPYSALCRTGLPRTDFGLLYSSRRFSLRA
jgi:hypothetical protein